MSSQLGIISPNELNSPENHFASRFFNEAADPLCLANVEGYLVAVNKAWTDLLGYTSAELTATPYREFIHPDDRRVTASENLRAAFGYPSAQFRNRFRHKDGSYRLLSWTTGAAAEDGVFCATVRDETKLNEDQEPDLTDLLALRASLQLAQRDDGMTMVFQPIVNIQNRTLSGLEALSRFHLPPHRSPDQWFAAAAAAGLGPTFENLAIRKAVDQAGDLPAGTFLSINASPEVLKTFEFEASIARMDPARLVIEITEHTVVDDYPQLQHQLTLLRERGIRVAIDDAGAGYASLSHVVKLMPDFIKLDISLTRDVDHSPVKQALVTALTTFAREIGAEIIAEGVENAAELAHLEQVGVTQGQGYFLGKPELLPHVAPLGLVGRRAAPTAVILQKPAPPALLPA